MIGRAFLVLWYVLIGLVSPVSAAAETGAKWEAALQSYLDRASKLLEVPGAVAVVVTREGGATVLSSGVLCVGEADPVTPNASFGIGSLTKAFTATAAAGLVGDGVVTWDSHARELIPELELGDPVASERVTLRDLLAHRSGLADHNLLHANIDAAPAWVLPRLTLVETAGEFRERFHYSGLGYTVAGEMIGRASGSSWNDAVSKRLLRPLGMTSTTVGSPPGALAEVACGHLRWRGSMTAVEPLVLSVGAPANGLYATGKDLVRWLEFLLGEGELDGRRIVDAGALRETWTPHTAIGTSGPDLRAYGLGWYLSSRRGRRHMFHGGGGVGFTSQVRLFPRDGVAVAVLANRMASALPDVVAERASELLLGDEDHKDLLDRAVEMTARIEALHEAAGEALRSTTDPEAPPSVGVSSLAGCYANPAFGELEVWVEDDAAGVRFHGIDHTLDHLHDNVFVLSSPYTGDHSAAFTVDAGVVSSVSVPLGSPELDRVFTRGAGSCVNGEVGLDPVKLTAETLNRHRR